MIIEKIKTRSAIDSVQLVMLSRESDLYSVGKNMFSQPVTDLHVLETETSCKYQVQICPCCGCWGQPWKPLHLWLCEELQWVPSHVGCV